MYKGLLLFAAGIGLLAGGHAAAQSSIAEDVLNGCQAELDDFCEGVTPGEGRILSCLYAYSDQLSGQCEYALYDAAARLERAINALTYVANECDADIESFCGQVEAGEGRIAQCLNEHASDLSTTCTTALNEVGLMEGQ